MPPAKKPESDDKLYIVDRIVRHRITKAGLQYFVKWQHYASKHNSWIPANHFYSSNLVDAYHKRLEADKAAGKAKITQKARIAPKSKMANKKGKTEADAKLVMEPLPLEIPPFVELFANERYEPGGVLCRMIDLHVRLDNDERVALIEWRKGTPNNFSFLREYVPIEWMHANHPQMAIKYYESRLFFINKHSGHLEKCKQP